MRLLILTSEIGELLRVGRTKSYDVASEIRSIYPTSAKLTGRVLVADFCDYYNFSEAQVQAWLADRKRVSPPASVSSA